jgi:hypothetical protein
MASPLSTNLGLISVQNISLHVNVLRDKIIYNFFNEMGFHFLKILPKKNWNYINLRMSVCVEGQISLSAWNVDCHIFAVEENNFLRTARTRLSQGWPRGWDRFAFDAERRPWSGWGGQSVRFRHFYSDN